MNGKRSSALSALLAMAMALGVIVVGMYAGVPVNLTTTTTGHVLTTSTVSTSNQGSLQSVSLTTSQTTSQTTQSAQSTPPASGSSASQGGEGTLSILLTDPPNIPQGVTKVYLSYRDLDVHVSNAGNQSGWTLVQSQGEIELLGTVNASKTLSSVKVAAGDYNQLRFNISSAVITYNSQNYTAFVQSAELIVPIADGGVPVNATGPTAAIIDISPTVVNIGSAATPEFIIRSVAVAYPVPSGAVTTEMQVTGGRVMLSNVTWWQRILRHSNSDLTIGQVTLSPTSLGLTVANTGNRSTQITLVVISPLIAPEARGYLPGSFLGAAVFAILPNGTLVPLRQVMPLTGGASSAVQASVSPIVFGYPGYNLTAGASVSLSYQGPIHLGFLTADALQTSIVPGQTYLVTVLGEQTTVSAAVVAS